MKIKNILFIILMILTLIFFSKKLQSFIHLNALSIDVLNTLFKYENSSKVTGSLKIKDKQNCHSLWLENMLDYYYKDSIDQNRTKYLIECSILFPKMVMNFLPNDIQISQYSKNLYPLDVKILLWHVNALEKINLDLAEKRILEIYDNYPSDFLVITSVGLFFERNLLLDKALEFYSSLCFRNDPFFIGCFNAGRISEKDNMYKDALYYYELSKMRDAKIYYDRLYSRIFKDLEKNNKD